MMKRILTLFFAAGLAACSSSTAVRTPDPVAPGEMQAAKAAGPQLVTLDSPSPMIAIKIMIKAGSTADPRGKEGLANLVADSLIDGGFGTAADPTTKEELAEITQPWGDDAKPSNMVSAETTTFYMTVPRDVLPTYINRVLRPMLTMPLFMESEITRLKDEAKAGFSAARFENLEQLGLAVLDQYVNEGTGYDHAVFGSERGINSLTRADVIRFYEAFYRPANMIVGVSSNDPAVTQAVMNVVSSINQNASGRMPSVNVGDPKMPTGRVALVVEEPNAPAAGVHIGFPLEINREDADFWPLYVAQTWFGTHRDSTGRLYQQIRQTRGYNYGDYAYIEHWNGKPFSLFQIFNQPRTEQYFSIWIRPVQHEYAYHIAKASTYELERLIEQGLTDEEVASAKKKAKVLYVNLAETVDRLLGAKMDDAFYGMQPGYLEGYLNRLDRVTTAQVNRAIREHLQTRNMKYVFVTDSAHVDELVDQLNTNREGYGKSLADYQITTRTLDDGTVVYEVPESKLPMLREDALWATTPLDIDSVRKVSVESIFKGSQLVTP